MKNTKRCAVLLLALVMMLAAVSCAQEESDAPEGFVLYENEDADYYFYYPEGWLENRADAGETSVKVSDTDFSNVSVNAFTFSSEYTSLPDYAERFYVPQLEKNFGEVRIEREQDENQTIKHSILEIDDCDTISFSYGLTLDGEYNFCVWLISHNGYVYSVLYTAKAELYEKNYDAAEQIALNIRFK